MGCVVPIEFDQTSSMQSMDPRFAPLAPDQEMGDHRGGLSKWEPQVVACIYVST